MHLYAVVLADPTECAATAMEMRELLRVQREAPQNALNLHFVSASWVYQCVHEVRLLRFVSFFRLLTRILCLFKQAVLVFLQNASYSCLLRFPLLCRLFRAV